MKDTEPRGCGGLLGGAGGVPGREAMRRLSVGGTSPMQKGEAETTAQGIDSSRTSDYRNKSIRKQNKIQRNHLKKKKSETR